MIPLSQIGLELLLGLGVALAGANALALAQSARDRRSGRKDARKVRAPGRAWTNIGIGTVVALWALLSLIARH